MSAGPAAEVVAGVDVGNATTEVVLVRGTAVLAAGRAPTSRHKGSPESLAGAAALVARLARRHGLVVDRAVAAPLRPVRTTTLTVPEEAPDTGRLRVVRAGAATAGGGGFAAGRPVEVGETPDGDDPVVLVVPAGTGYRAAVEAAAPLLDGGRLAAVVLEDDEAVLVANRLGGRVPVVDDVPAAAVLGAQRLAVEVSVDGRPLATTTDPLALGAALGLAPAEQGGAARLAVLLFDVRNAVVALDATALPRADAATRGWVELGADGRVPLLDGVRRVRDGTVGEASGYALPDRGDPSADARAEDVDDLFAVDLVAVAEAVHSRTGSTAGRPVGLAALRTQDALVDPAPALERLLGVPVTTAPSEAAAARVGALTTPGAGPAAVVVDLGGGTVDAVTAERAVVAAGAGELLTSSVAALAGCTTAAAEWVKRGPAARAEAPQVLLGEDGVRSFLDTPAPAETIGRLVVSGPAGLLPFSSTWAPGEWRALRRRLKTDLLGANVARALRTLGSAPGTVVLVGGAVGDEEVLAAVAGALPAGTAVGRGDVAGELGHRYAVAYGLALTQV